MFSMAFAALCFSRSLASHGSSISNPVCFKVNQNTTKTRSYSTFFLFLFFFGGGHGEGETEIKVKKKCEQTYIVHMKEKSRNDEL
jgi:hypothetical protein